MTQLAYRLLGWSGDPEAIVQEVFLTAYLRAATFRGDSSLWTWLTVITLNRCRTWHRRQRVWRRVKGVLLGRAAAKSEAVDVDLIADDTARQVREAVRLLPPGDREVITLAYFEHRTSSQIAELLNATQNAIEIRLQQHAAVRIE